MKRFACVILLFCAVLGCRTRYDSHIIEVLFQYSPNYPGIGEAVSFTDMSVSSHGQSISSWHWDFGDGFTSDVQNPTHSYTAKGIYTVTLTVTGNESGVFYTQKPVRIGFASPVANFTFAPSSPIVDENVQFTDLSTDPDTAFGDSVASWDWQFGIGATPVSSTQQNPVCTFQSSGVHTVTLTVKDTLGMSNSTSLPVDVQ